MIFPDNTWRSASEVQLLCIVLDEPCEWIVKYQAMQELNRRDQIVYQRKKYGGPKGYVSTESA